MPIWRKRRRSLGLAPRPQTASSFFVSSVFLGLQVYISAEYNWPKRLLLAISGFKVVCSFEGRKALHRRESRTNITLSITRLRVSKGKIGYRLALRRILREIRRRPRALLDRIDSRCGEVPKLIAIPMPIHGQFLSCGAATPVSAWQDAYQ